MRIKIIALVAIIVIGLAGYSYKDTILGFFTSKQVEDLENIEEDISLNSPSSDNIILSSPQDAKDVSDIGNIPEPPPSNSPTPVIILTNTCKEGKSDACVSLAKLYLEGLGGVKRDPIKSINILTRPCEDEDANACAMLAKIYDEGIGVTSSIYLYLGYINKACDFGDIDSCYNMAVNYYRGHGNDMKKDIMKAFYLFKKTCDKGRVEGCNNLAVLYNNGNNGIPKNMNLAKSLFENACTNGYKPSCDNLKKIFPK